VLSQKSNHAGPVALGWRKVRELLGDREGVALVEMAVAAPMLALLITGITDVSMYAAKLLKAQQAVNRGLEMSMMGGPGISTTDIQTQAAAQAEVPIGNVTVTQTLECSGVGTIWSASCVSGQETARYTKIQLTTEYRPSLVLGSLAWMKTDGNGNIPISATGVIRVQ
jgi:Flp pilus assembly protein TadG